MIDESNREKASSLRTILSVIEERSHLGLNDEITDNLRRILTRKIARTESGAARAGWQTPAAVEDEIEVSA
jgi:hypothetical protein